MSGVCVLAHNVRTDLGRVFPPNMFKKATVESCLSQSSNKSPHPTTDSLCVTGAGQPSRINYKIRL